MILFIIIMFLLGRLLFSPFRRRYYSPMMFTVPRYRFGPMGPRRGFGMPRCGMHHFGPRMYR